MKKFIILSTIVASLTAGSFQRIYANDGIGLTIRGGAFFSSKNASWVYGGTFATAGLEYQVKDFNPKSTRILGTLGCSLSADVIAQSVTGGLSLRNATEYNFPILANLVYRFYGFTFSAGAGVAINSCPGGFTASRANFAYQGSVGYDFLSVPRLGVEIRYIGNSDSRLNGLSTNLTIRL